VQELADIHGEEHRHLRAGRIQQIFLEHHQVFNSTRSRLMPSIWLPSAAVQPLVALASARGLVTSASSASPANAAPLMLNETNNARRSMRSVALMGRYGSALYR
jgi:hypothetical protein